MRLWRPLLRYFAQGVLIAAPILLTLYLVITLMAAIDGLMHVPIPGLGLVTALCLLTLLGFVASSVIGKRAVSLAEGVLRRVPLVKLLYRALKDLVGAFVGERKGFDRPVVVQLSEGGPVVLGFITRENVALEGLESHVAVYLPQAYNFAGNLVFMRRSSLKPLDVKSSELMSFIISGGIAGFQPASILPPKSTPM